MHLGYKPTHARSRAVCLYRGSTLYHTIQFHLMQFTNYEFIGLVLKFKKPFGCRGIRNFSYIKDHYVYQWFLYAFLIVGIYRSLLRCSTRWSMTTTGDYLGYLMLGPNMQTIGILFFWATVYCNSKDILNVIVCLRCPFLNMYIKPTLELTCRRLTKSQAKWCLIEGASTVVSQTQLTIANETQSNIWLFFFIFLQISLFTVVYQLVDFFSVCWKWAGPQRL